MTPQMEKADRQREIDAIQACMASEATAKNCDPVTLGVKNKNAIYLKNRVESTLIAGIEIGRRLQIDRDVEVLKWLLRSDASHDA